MIFGKEESRVLPLSETDVNLSPTREDDRDAGAERQTTQTAFTVLGAVSARRYPVTGRTLFLMECDAGLFSFVARVARW